MGRFRVGFYSTNAWDVLRRAALRRDRYTCQHCGVLCLGKKRKCPSPHVDHILPIRDRPDLELTLSNLQVLCASCHFEVEAVEPDIDLSVESKTLRGQYGSEIY